MELIGRAGGRRRGPGPLSTDWVNARWTANAITALADADSVKRIVEHRNRCLLGRAAKDGPTGRFRSRFEAGRYR